MKMSFLFCHETLFYIIYVGIVDILMDFASPARMVEEQKCKKGGNAVRLLRKC